MSPETSWGDSGRSMVASEAAPKVPVDGASVGVSATSTAVVGSGTTTWVCPGFGMCINT